jgi:hypothetical protein
MTTITEAELYVQEKEYAPMGSISGIPAYDAQKIFSEFTNLKPTELNQPRGKEFRDILKADDSYFQALPRRTQKLRSEKVCIFK